MSERRNDALKRPESFGAQFEYLGCGARGRGTAWAWWRGSAWAQRHGARDRIGRVSAGRGGGVEVTLTQEMK